MTDIAGLVSLIEGFLEEVRVIRSRRTPSRVRLKRKRYYRRRKAKLKRLAKRRRRQPRQKRLAKRRATIRKRMHIRPGSRRRIRLVTSIRESMEGLMSYKIEQLVRGFRNAAKLAECLKELRGYKPQPKVEEKVFNEWDMELPSFDPTDELDEDFAKLCGFVTEDIPVSTDGNTLNKIFEDAKHMLEVIQLGECDEVEAHQVLVLMAEHLDKTVEQLLTEDIDEEEFVTIYFKKDQFDEIQQMKLADKLEQELEREVSLVGTDSVNIYTQDPKIIAKAVEIIGKENIAEIPSEIVPFDIKTAHKPHQGIEYSNKKKEEVSKESIASMKRTIMDKMSKIETSKGKMFHELDQELDDEIVAAIDSNNMAKMNSVIKKLDDMDESITEAGHPDGKLFGLVIKKHGRYFAKAEDGRLFDLKDQDSGSVFLSHEIFFHVNEMDDAVDLESADSEGNPVVSKEKYPSIAIKKQETSENPAILRRQHPTMVKSEGSDLEEMSRVVTDKIGQAFKEGTPKKVANTYTDGKSVFLHNNEIVKREGGQIWITNAGWPTRVTHERINGILTSLGITGGVTLRGGKSMLNNKEWDGSWTAVGKDPLKECAAPVESSKENIRKEHGKYESYESFDSQVKDLEKRLTESKKVMSEAFMKPEVFHSKGIEVDTSSGTQFIPSDVVEYTGPDTEEAEEIGKQFAQIKDYLEVHKPDQVFSIHHIEGWFGRLSAPGYLDATDYIFGDSEEEVEQELKNLYGDEEEESITESVTEDIAKEIALVWACDSIAQEAEEHEEIRDDFVRSQMDIMDTVPSALEDAGLDIEGYLDIETAKDLIGKINKEWAGKLTVEELYNEFGESLPHLIALQSQGHGVGLEDEQEISDFLKEKGVKNFEAHAYEAGLPEATVAVYAYAEKNGINLGNGENMEEADPSLQAPKRWFNKMLKRVSGDDPAAIVGAIWRDLPVEKKKEIRGREGKTYGPAESVTEDNKKPRVFQTKEQAVEFIKKFVPDIVEPYFEKTKAGYIIKYFQDGFMKTLYEDSVTSEKKKKLWHVEIEVKQLAPNSELDADDKAENPSGVWDINVQANNKEQAEEFGLDEFHETVPIAVLDDFDISVSVEEITEMLEMAYSAIALKPGVKFPATNVLALRKEIGVPVTGLTGEPKVLRVGTQDDNLLGKAQDIIGRDKIGRVEKGAAALMQGKDK